MRVEQVYDLVNQAGQEATGGSAILNEDFSNIVDFGTTIFSNGADAVDSYCRSLINRIGKTVFVDRKYKGKFAKVMREAWEYACMLMKVDTDLPEATENESWNISNGVAYDPTVVHLPEVHVKYYKDRSTFEIDRTFARLQVKQSFNNLSELMAFFAMIEQWIENGITIKVESLARGLVNNMTAETVFSEYGSGSQTAASHTRAVNLLYLYNQDHAGATLTAANCLKSPEFLRFAAYVMGTYKERLASMSKLFNIDGRDRFTPDDRLHVVLLADFAKAADVYLYGDTFHEALVRLPEATDILPFWQGSGTSYAYADVSKINVTTPKNHTVTVNGILGVMFDRDAVAICNEDRRVTSYYNPKIEATTNFYKYDAAYFADTAENFVVFFAA